MAKGVHQNRRTVVSRSAVGVLQTILIARNGIRSQRSRISKDAAHRAVVCEELDFRLLRCDPAKPRPAGAKAACSRRRAHRQAWAKGARKLLLRRTIHAVSTDFPWARALVLVQFPIASGSLAPKAFLSSHYLARPRNSFGSQIRIVCSRRAFAARMSSVSKSVWVALVSERDSFLQPVGPRIKRIRRIKRNADSPREAGFSRSAPPV